MGGTLRLVLGDQLTESLTALRGCDPERDVVLMAEVRAEASYVRHHKQKLALIFGAMRNFAERLQDRGVAVRYVRLDDPANSGSIVGELDRMLADQPFNRVAITRCGEWRLQSELDAFARRSAVPVEMREDERFLCSTAAFERWAEGRSTLTMEFFYRDMRRLTGLLMDGGKPAGGRWNFDAENRRKLPRAAIVPQRLRIAPNPTTQRAIDDVAAWFPDHFGDLDEFGWPTTAGEAEAALAEFLSTALPLFGERQDAMAAGEPWLSHSLISTSLNIGLLDPLEVCRRAEAEHRAGRAPLNAVEGFIRQIIGWREWVRGIYWLKMPDYAELNALGADRRLPDFYWSGDTEMACVRDVVEGVRRNAYAHHIQRLMVTGRLAMLLGVHPDEINDWYMVVFADAFEWVELPNTHGMATFADGGIVGTKPYAAAGAYTARMSDYCGRCVYKPGVRLEEDGCPFDPLYWDFLIQHRGVLERNPRLYGPYRQVQAMTEDHRQALQRRAETVRRRLGAVRRDEAPIG